jgi:hypothetical protein
VLRLGRCRGQVPGPDDPARESTTLIGLGRAQLLQLLPVDARQRGQGIDDFEDVGEFFRVAIGGEELRDFLGQLFSQPGPYPAASAT